MQLSNIPSRIISAFASSAQALKRVIPQPAQSGIVRGRASFADGFPPECGSLTNGVAPSIYDYNGILNAITAVQQWQSGGGLFTWDSAWSQANAGYPKGAVLLSTSGDKIWMSMVDNNMSDPDLGGGTAWAAFYPGNPRITTAAVKLLANNPFVTFTGIPSWAQRITVNINAMSTNGTSLPIIQLGTSAGTVTTNYANTAMYVNTGSNSNGMNISNGIAVSNNNIAADIRYGQLVFTLLGSNTWVVSGVTGLTNAASIGLTGGAVVLPGALDRLVVSTVNGTDLFDGGSVSLIIEG